jgi:hypothetical protein
VRTPIPAILSAISKVLDGIHETDILDIEINYDDEIHVQIANRDPRDGLELITLAAIRMDTVRKILSVRTSHDYWRVEVRGRVNGVHVQPVLLLDREPTDAQLAPLRALVQATEAA